MWLAVQYSHGCIACNPRLRIEIEQERESDEDKWYAQIHIMLLFGMCVLRSCVSTTSCGQDVASTDVCYVSNVASIPPIKRRVNLNSRQCTCGYTSQFGIPCRHIVACLESLGKLSSVFDLFDSCYTVPSYSSAFSSKAIYIPLSTELSKDTSSLPAKVLKKAGRPKKKRIRSNGEEGVSITFRCSKCYQSGHNKRTCTTN
jgi:hypothetical protein